MNKRKNNLLKLGVLLFVSSWFLWNCNVEETPLEKESVEVIRFENVESVSKKDAMEHFKTRQLGVLQKRSLANGQEKSPLEIKPDWNTFKYNDVAYTEAKLVSVDSEVNRPGSYTSELYFIEVNGHTRNVIFTLWKDKVDANGNVIDGRMFFNDLEGKFIDGYIIEDGIFTKRYVVITKAQEASILPLYMFFQSLTTEGDCWNTDLLDGVPNNVLQEVVLSGSGSGTNGSSGSDSQSGPGHSASYNWYYTVGAGSVDYSSFVNGAVSGGHTMPTGGGGSTSLSSGQIASAAGAILIASSIEPDEKGNCPDGYTKNPETGDCNPICSGGKIYNTTTKKCECPDGKIENLQGICVEDPCKEINTQMQDSKFTEKIKELEGKTGLKKESGYIEDKDGTYKALATSTSGHSLDIKAQRTTVGFFHTHLNDFESGEFDDKTGAPLEDQPIRMFSPADVIQFLKIARYTKYNGIPLNSIYGMMITSSRTYELRFTGSVDDITGIRSAKEYENAYLYYFKKKHPFNKEKAFLKFLKNEIKVKGLELYRIRSNGEVQKKNLTSSGSVETTDCE